MKFQKLASTLSANHMTCCHSWGTNEMKNKTKDIKVLKFSDSAKNGVFDMKVNNK